MLVPEKTELEIIVVESGAANQARDIVRKFSDELEITVINEPNTGIVFARNAGVEALLESGAEWMVSFDDDVIVSPDWLLAMVDAFKSYPDCHAFAGPQNRLAAEGAGRWLPFRPSPDRETGTVNWDVSTASAVFRRCVFALDSLALRFEGEFNFSGGEDTRLFYRLKDKGEKIRWVKEAVVSEPMTGERARLRSRAARYSLQAHNWGRITILRFGGLRGRALVFWFMLASALNVVSFAVIGVFTLVYSEPLGIKTYNMSLVNGCEAIGYFRALFMKDSRFYARSEAPPIHRVA